jgi:hypothetical protein
LLLVVIKWQIDYTIRVTLKLQREGLKSIEVKKEAAQDDDKYIEVHYLYCNATCDLQTHYFRPALFPDGQCYLHNSAPTASHLFTLQTVYSEKCRSWYKMGKDEGCVTGL